MVESGESKKSLRKRILTLLKNQSEEERLIKSRVILGFLINSPEFQKASVILFYASFNGEVETFEMMKQAKNLGKTIGLPTVIEETKEIIPVEVNHLEHLQAGPYGIKEPPKGSLEIPLEKIDLAIIPGVAFDKGNNRLGRGAGYYDRFLKKFSPHFPAIGIAFDFQLVDNVPFVEGQDLPVSRVIIN